MCKHPKEIVVYELGYCNKDSIPYKNPFHQCSNYYSAVNSGEVCVVVALQKKKNRTDGQTLIWNFHVIRMIMAHYTTRLLE